MLLSILQFARRTAAGCRLDRIPGLYNLYCWLFNTIKPSGVTSMRIQGHRIKFLADDTGIAPSLLTFGVYEPQATALLSKILQPGMVFLDVGANFGYFSIIAASKVGPRGAVISVEPEPFNFALLTENVHVNGYNDRCICIPECAGASESTETLFLDVENAGNHSLLRKNIPTDVNRSIPIRLRTVDAMLADQNIERADVIKIDTQGAEVQVLRGMTEALRGVACVMIEFWPFGIENFGNDPQELLSILRKVGLSLIDCDNMQPLYPQNDDDLVARCKGRKNGRGYMNIVAQR